MQQPTLIFMLLTLFVVSNYISYQRGESKLRRQKIKEAKALRDSQPKAVVIKNK